MSIEKQLIALIKQHPSVTGEVTINSAFNDLGCDSLDVLEIVISIDIFFDIDLPDELYMRDKFNEFKVSDVLAAIIKE